MLNRCPYVWVGDAVDLTVAQRKRKSRDMWGSRGNVSFHNPSVSCSKSDVAVVSKLGCVWSSLPKQDLNSVPRSRKCWANILDDDVFIMDAPAVPLVVCCSALASASLILDDLVAPAMRLSAATSLDGLIHGLLTTISSLQLSLNVPSQHIEKLENIV